MGMRRHARRTVEFGNIFAKEFGETTRTGRIRPVLLWFWLSPGGVGDMLGWVNRTYGPPDKELYGAGAAWYIDAYSTVDLNAAFATLNAWDEQNRRNIGQMAEITASYGIKQVAYEGGIGMSGRQNIAVKLAANRDPRIEPILEHHFLQNWFGQGGDLYCYFNLYGGYGPFGCWGLTEEDISKLNTKVGDSQNHQSPTTADHHRHTPAGSSRRIGRNRRSAYQRHPQAQRPHQRCLRHNPRLFNQRPRRRLLRGQRGRPGDESASDHRQPPDRRCRQHFPS